MQLVTKNWRLEGICEAVSHTFVHIRSREPWLTRAVLGTSDKGDMKPGVLTDLRSTVEKMEKRIRSGLPTEDIKPDDDPMDEMVPVCQTPEPRKKKQVFVAQVCRLRMPEWPGEAMNGNATIEREVRVLLDGNGKLWIHTGDIEWLIRSLWIHQQLKGVDDVASE